MQVMYDNVAHYNTPLKVGRSTKPSQMASLVSKDTSPNCLRPVQQASPFPVETNTAYMSAWEFIAQLRCSFALSRLVITRTVQFRIQNMALLCWLLAAGTAAPFKHKTIKIKQVGTVGVLQLLVCGAHVVKICITPPIALRSQNVQMWPYGPYWDWENMLPSAKIRQKKVNRFLVSFVWSELRVITIKTIHQP